eukprot:TRINITY_DN19827_c0_g1_i1.p1 TRINITY_DN19827_c0_g1~~TRINITY_DN19827_c0_g1_i1.p1  ORF type:complete len:113 (+),score=5.28 TRINITY_DN19827_c0_g1_i1:505-843(+)
MTCHHWSLPHFPNLQDLPMWERQEKWMASIRRAYKDEADKARRLKIFTENVEYVESFNKQEGQTYRLSITDSMDLTDKEMRGWYIIMSCWVWYPFFTLLISTLYVSTLQSHP